MDLRPASLDPRSSPTRANRRVALALAGIALAFFCAVIVNHLPA